MRIGKTIVAILIFCLSMAACAPRAAVPMPDSSSTVQSRQSAISEGQVSSVGGSSVHSENSMNNQKPTFAEVAIYPPQMNDLFEKFGGDVLDRNTLALAISFSQLPNAKEWEDLTSGSFDLYDLETYDTIAYQEGVGNYILVVPKYLKTRITVEEVSFMDGGFQTGKKIVERWLDGTHSCLFKLNLPEGGPTTQINVFYGTKFGSFRPTYDGTGVDIDRTANVILAEAQTVRTLDQSMMDGSTTAIECGSAEAATLLLSNQGTVYSVNNLFDPLSQPAAVQSLKSIQSISAKYEFADYSHGAFAVDDGGTLWSSPLHFSDETGLPSFSQTPISNVASVDHNAFVDRKGMVWLFDQSLQPSQTGIAASQAAMDKDTLLYIDPDAQFCMWNRQTQKSTVLLSQIKKFTITNASPIYATTYCFLTIDGDLLLYRPSMPAAWSQLRTSFQSELTCIRHHIVDYAVASGSAARILTVDQDKNLVEYVMLYDAGAIFLIDEGKRVAENVKCFGCNDDRIIWTDANDDTFIR